MAEALLECSMAKFSTSLAIPRREFHSQFHSRRFVVRAATGTVSTINGRRRVLSFGDKLAKFRDKAPDNARNIRLLSRIEQLRLLTKAEKAGLLSTAENLGFTLSSIEKLGLLSKAEELGVLSAATDPSTPGVLFATSLALLALGPVFVYVVPENSLPLVVLQCAVAAISVLAGSAAFAASNFVATIQGAD